MITIKEDELLARHNLMSIRLAYAQKTVPKKLSNDHFVEYTIEQAREHFQHKKLYLMNGWSGEYVIEPED